MAYISDSGWGSATAVRECSGRPAPVDVESFVHELYTQHGYLLLRYAARLLGGDWHRAEDILQEAVLRAWQHSAKLEGDTGALRPWLFTVVRNLAIDDHRVRQAQPLPLDALDDADVPVADAVERLLTDLVVSEAMEELTEQHREVLARTYYLGDSVAQVALSLGVPPGTVKSRTYYAVRALGEELGTRGVFG